ncbi:hypothetical protein CARUB_v10004790mg [Capsella rubella]|uniref:Extracellular ligand-gated ion channel protein n=1 Tax=Capsella rubella TaxID=81985 RepID=R0GIF3_9BRAS|nr:uncharacterized protein LOC17879245 isoform X1 [Capsella rubella]EOA16619.1 hypothetical protein CARUB_v10004790mg [Capsella rubella]
MANTSSERGSREHLLRDTTRPSAINNKQSQPEFPSSRFTFMSLVLWFDQSNCGTALLSWSVFFLLVVIVPMISHFLLVCSDCDFHHRRPYDAVVQLSLSIFAGISFFSLSIWSRKFGMRKFLFLDKLWDVSDKVRIEHEAEIQQRSLKRLMIFVFPSLTLEAIYRIWWYISGFNQIPYIINPVLSHVVACTLQLSSWLYRNAIFIVVCILYQITCHLQTLRLEDFARCFASEITDVSSALGEHQKIRRNLRIVSHRFRRFILLSLVLVTATQFMALLTTTRASVAVNIYEVGELALCSLSLVTGVFICLRSATKITHKAQSVTSLAAKWNVCATVDSFDHLDGETPTASMVESQISPCGINAVDTSDDEEGEGDDDLDNTKIHPIYANTISYQKRQALVTYLENNKAGITVYGFLVDRSWLHTIFGIELALLLWLLNKTIVNIP